jgi:hypothetical protein
MPYAPPILAPGWSRTFQLSLQIRGRLLATGEGARDQPGRAFTD